MSEMLRRKGLSAADADAVGNDAAPAAPDPTIDPARAKELAAAAPYTSGPKHRQVSRQHDLR